jgi:hypothetical protein
MRPGEIAAGGGDYAVIEINQEHLLDADRRLGMLPIQVRPIELLRLPIAPSRGDCIAPVDSHNAALAARYARALESAREFGLAVLEFADVAILGSRGLIAERAAGGCLVGAALGWGPGFLRGYVEGELRGRFDEATRAFRLPESTNSTRLGETVILLAAPGIGVYGHWILQVIPRLHFLERVGLIGRYPIAVPSLAPWAVEILALYGVRREHLIVLEESSVHEAARLLVPTNPCCGHLLFKPLVRAAWSSYRDRLAALAGADAPVTAERLFVSRRRWVGARKLLDYDGLAGALARAGYREVFPETLSLAAQAVSFENAPGTVGEQGSAMHNLAFSRPNTRHLILMAAGQSSLFHAAVADTLGLRLAFAETQWLGEGLHIAPEHVLSTLAALMEAP